MGVRSLEMLNSFSARTDFRRQILTSEVGPRTEMVKLYIIDNNGVPALALHIQTLAQCWASVVCY